MKRELRNTNPITSESISSLIMFFVTIVLTVATVAAAIALVVVTGAFVFFILTLLF